MVEVQPVVRQPTCEKPVAEVGLELVVDLVVQRCWEVVAATKEAPL